MYATYQYYTDMYRGKLTSEKEWPKLCVEASAYIDMLTFGRLRCGAEITDSVKMAVCAVAETIQHRNTETAARAEGVKSESVGSQSVTYEDAATAATRFETEKRAAADLYLPRSDPLRYAGVL